MEGRRACKGYEKRILSSLFGMQDEQSDLYAPRPFFAKGEEKKKGCVSLRADYSMYREPRASQPFLPDNSVSKSSRR